MSGSVGLAETFGKSPRGEGKVFRVKVTLNSDLSGKHGVAFWYLHEGVVHVGFHLQTLLKLSGRVGGFCFESYQYAIPINTKSQANQ